MQTKDTITSLFYTELVNIKTNFRIIMVRVNIGKAETSRIYKVKTTRDVHSDT